MESMKSTTLSKLGRPRRARFVFTVVAFALSAASVMTGCSVVREIIPRNKVKSINVEVQANANLNTAVALDVVFVYADDLIARLDAVTAEQWFVRRQDFRLDYPKGFDLISWELAPGQQAPKRSLPDRHKHASAVIVFAGYQTSGPHRARVEKIKKVVIDLGEKDFTVSAKS